MATQTIQAKDANEHSSNEEPVALKSEETGGTANEEPDTLESEETGSSVKHQEAGSDDGDRKRRINRILTFAVPVLILALAFVLWYLFTFNWDKWEAGRTNQTTDNATVQADVIPLSTKAVGIVETVNVQDYQPVKEGDVLVTLRSSDVQATVAQAQAGINAAQEALNNIRLQRQQQEDRIRQAQLGVDVAQADLHTAQIGLNNVQNDIASARIGIETASDDVRNAEAGIEAVSADVERTTQERSRQENLFEAQATTKQRLEVVTADHERAAATLKARQLDRSKAQALVRVRQQDLSKAQNLDRVRAQDLRKAQRQLQARQNDFSIALKQLEILNGQERQLQHDLNAKQASLTIANTNLDYTKILAPRDGVVGEVKVKPGQQLGPGAQVASLVSTEMWIIANFKETQIASLKEGDPVEIVIDAFSGITVKGRVATVSPASGSEFSLIPPENASGSYTRVTQRVPVKIVFEPNQSVVGRRHVGDCKRQDKQQRQLTLRAEKMTALRTAISNPTAGDEPIVSSYVERNVRAVFTHPALGILGVLTGGWISVLSGLLLSVGLADVRAGMRLGVDEASWIPTVYNMALIFIGILSVHLGTIFGQRKVLLIASVVSTVAFFLAPFAATRPQLMFLLLVAGLGVGPFYPLILGYLLRALPLPLAVFGVAVYVIDVLVPSYLANWMEGIISNYFTWHWIFWTPALVIPFVFVFVYFGIPRAPVDYGGERPNFAGFFYAAWGFAFLYGAIDQGERLDWFESGTFVGLLLAAVLMLGAMVVRRFWTPNPLVRFRFLNDRNLILLGALLLLFRFSLLTTNLLVPAFLSGVADYRPVQTGQVVWWGLIPQVVIAPLVVILLVKLDVRFLLAAGFALAAAACLMFGRINPQWSDVDFFNPIILQAVGQPFIVIGLVGSIILVMVAKGALNKPWELATVTAFFQTVRLLGGAVTAAVLKHFITVQNKFHTMVVTENIQQGDWRTAEHLQSFAKQAAAGGGAQPEQAAQASRLWGAFIKEQVLTLTVADGFYFIGGAIVVCLILVAVLRAMPLALPAAGK